MTEDESTKIVQIHSTEISFYENLEHLKQQIRDALSVEPIHLEPVEQNDKEPTFSHLNKVPCMVYHCNRCEAIMMYCKGEERNRDKWAAEHVKAGCSRQNRDCVLSALHHIFKFLAGENIDSESGLHHLAHAAWNCLTVVEYMTLKTYCERFDDRSFDGATREALKHVAKPEDQCTHNVLTKKCGHKLGANLYSCSDCHMYSCSDCQKFWSINNDSTI